MLQSLIIIGSSVLTVGVHVFTQLRLGLAVGPVAGLVAESGRHGGYRDNGFKRAFPLLHVELWVEDDHVDFWHVEHPEGHGRTEVHGDGQRGRLDVELQREEDKTVTGDWSTLIQGGGGGEGGKRNVFPTRS